MKDRILVALMLVLSLTLALMLTIEVTGCNPAVPNKADMRTIIVSCPEHVKINGVPIALTAMPGDLSKIADDSCFYDEGGITVFIPPNRFVHGDPK